MNKNKMHKVLNHGELQLVDSMGSDLAIVDSARQSYGGKGKTRDAKLIGYLMNNGHNTPFESGEAQFHIKAPIFVVRQWHRHRTQSYNELSARYTKLPTEYYVPDAKQITTQSKDNKQMRTDEQNIYANAMANAIDAQNAASFAIYDKMIEDGCPREIARSVLPCGTYTVFRAKANLHNWFGFLYERLHEHAQYEIRVYADAILGELYKLFPIAVMAFVSKNWERIEGKSVEKVLRDWRRENGK